MSPTAYQQLGVCEEGAEMQLSNLARSRWDGWRKDQSRVGIEGSARTCWPGAGSSPAQVRKVEQEFALAI